MPIAARRAFSLVELVIVIVILGIIAAVAVPRISSSSRNAGESALRANLASIRNAIDWYHAEHKATLPSAKSDGVNAAGSPEAFRRQLKQYSNSDGQVSVAKNPAFPFGPYIRGRIPCLTVGAKAGNRSLMVVDQPGPLTTDLGGDRAWIYNVATGEFIPNAPEIGSNGQPYASW